LLNEVCSQHINSDFQGLGIRKPNRLPVNATAFSALPEPLFLGRVLASVDRRADLTGEICTSVADLSQEQI